jgi:hypothetical protein
MAGPHDECPWPGDLAIEEIMRPIRHGGTVPRLGVRDRAGALDAKVVQPALAVVGQHDVKRRVIDLRDRMAIGNMVRVVLCESFSVKKPHIG